MNKTSVEIRRAVKHLAGYGVPMDPYTPDAPIVLDHLLEWAQEPGNVGKRVYRHLLRRVEENVRKATLKEAASDKEHGIGRLVHHRCDLVYYLDIYWQ